MTVVAYAESNFLLEIALRRLEMRTYLTPRWNGDLDAIWREPWRRR